MVEYRLYSNKLAKRFLNDANVVLYNSWVVRNGLDQNGYGFSTSRNHQSCHVIKPIFEEIVKLSKFQFFLELSQKEATDRFWDSV